MSKIKRKSYARWRKGQVTREQCRNNVQTCRKANMLLGLKLVRGMKHNPSGFCRFISN